MLSYLLKSALLLAFLYGGFALLLSRETFHRFNRLALLSVLVASQVLPAVQLTMNKPHFLSSPALYQSPQNEKLFMGEAEAYGDEGDIGANETSADYRDKEETTPLALWTGVGGETVLSLLYLAGLLVSVGIFLFQLFRFWQETQGGTRTHDKQGNTIVIRGGKFVPYSFFHIIIISVSDYERLREPILAHEQAHIRLGHSWDLLLLEAVKAVQWFNPFVYLLGRDLKAVHEYEADNAVLNLGIDAKTYQLLLVTKAVGNRLQTLGNNLSHNSLKKRIKMMNKNSSNRWLMTKAVILPALMALAVVAFAKPKSDILPVTNEQEGNIMSSKVDNTPIYSEVEVNADFKGGIDECYKWIDNTIHYPEEALAKKIQGRVFVKFVVEKDGHITQPKVLRSPDKQLSEEALRIVKLMPAWEPAKIDGKPVRSYLNLPITFKLPNK